MSNTPQEGKIIDEVVESFQALLADTSKALEEYQQRINEITHSSSQQIHDLEEQLSVLEKEFEGKIGSVTLDTLKE